MKASELISLLSKCPPDAEVGITCLDLHDTLMPIEELGISGNSRFVVLNNYKKSDILADGSTWMQDNDPDRYFDTDKITWLK